MYKYLLWFLLALLGLTACHVEKPSLPSWDIELNIPLMNEKYQISELVDNEFIFMNEDYELYIESSGELDTPDFGDISFAIPLDLGPVPILTGVDFEGSFSPHDPETGYLVSYGRISSGEIQARFTNVDAAVESITVTFAGLYNADRSPFAMSWNGNNGWQTADLTGAHLGVLDSGVFLDEVGIDIEISSSLPAESHAAEMELRVPGRVAFDHFQGNLHNYVLDAIGTTQSVEISYPHGVDQAVSLQSASLAISVTNPVGFPAVFTGELFARNDNSNETVTVPILDDDNQPLFINSAVGELPTQTQFIISNRISELMQIMPHHIEVRNPSFSFGFPSTSQIGFARTHYQVDGSYTLDAPFSFILSPSQIRLNSPKEVEISAENQDRISKHALSAGLSLQVLNKLPVSAEASIYIGISDSLDIDDPDTYSFKKDFTLHSYLVDSGYQELELSLNANEIAIFTNPKIYLQFAFKLDTGGEVVTITASPADFIQVRGMLAAKLLIQE